jgi:hypothetical protein
MNVQTAARNGGSPPGRASLSLSAMRSEPRQLVRVTPLGSRTNAAPHWATIWAMPKPIAAAAGANG